VHLKNFSLLSPKIQTNDLLKAIEIAIPATTIERAIAGEAIANHRFAQANHSNYY
jgi:hypothetical protein